MFKTRSVLQVIYIQPLLLLIILTVGQAFAQSPGSGRSLGTIVKKQVPRNKTFRRISQQQKNTSLQGSSNLNLKKKVESPNEMKFSWSTFLASSSNIMNKDPEKRISTVTNLNEISFKLAERWSVVSKVVYEKNLINPEESDFSDTPLLLIYKSWDKEDTFRFQPSLIAVAPTSKVSSTKKDFLYGGGFGGKIIVNPNSLFSPLLKFEFGANLIRNFHKYKTDIEDQTLNQYSSLQRIFLAYEGESFFSSLEFLHRNGYSYENELRESYEHTEEVGYNITSKFSVALGHSLSGNAIKENGESNYAFVNSTESLYYIGLGFVF